MQQHRNGWDDRSNNNATMRRDVSAFRAATGRSFARVVDTIHSFVRLWTLSRVHVMELIHLFSVTSHGVSRLE
jgi:hypothetical protein